MAKKKTPEQPSMNDIARDILRDVQRPDTAFQCDDAYMETDERTGMVDLYAVNARFVTADGKEWSAAAREWAEDRLLREGLYKPTAKPNARTEANERLKFAVRALFDLDKDQVLTVDDVKKLPTVQEWQERQGITDDTLTRHIESVAPKYAHPRSGPKDNWEDPPRIAR